MQGGPKQGAQYKSLVCCVAHENLEEESNIEKEEEVAVENDTQITTKEKLEESI